MLMLFIVYKIVETTFSNFRDDFTQISNTEFVHETSHIHVKPSKYDSTSSTKIFIRLTKIRRMKLLIGTSTFNKLH